MKKRPILFSAPMVHAILNGSKTQTRRVVKGFAFEWLTMHNGFNAKFVALPENHLCPYGQPGDRLWVRETFFAWGLWDYRHSVDKGRDEWHFTDRTLSSGLAYRYAVGHVGDNPRKRSAGFGTYWKRPAIFMPRVASRINLEITGVRVERLQDISEADAIAEGVEPIPYTGENAGPNKFSILLDGCWFNAPTAVEVYRILWESINGEGSWATNPWVWVVEFKRVMS